MYGDPWPIRHRVAPRPGRCRASGASQLGPNQNTGGVVFVLLPRTENVPASPAFERRARRVPPKRQRPPRPRAAPALSSVGPRAAARCGGLPPWRHPAQRPESDAPLRGSAAILTASRPRCCAAAAASSAGPLTYALPAARPRGVPQPRGAPEDRENHPTPIHPAVRALGGDRGMSAATGVNHPAREARSPVHVRPRAHFRSHSRSPLLLFRPLGRKCYFS